MTDPDLLPLDAALALVESPVRRTITTLLVRGGRISSLEVAREWPNFDGRWAAATFNRLLRLDLVRTTRRGENRHLYYRLTPAAVQGLRDLHAYLTDLLSHLEVADAE